MNFHLVHSVKGGCGKSVCALELAMMLNMKNYAAIPKDNTLPYDKLNVKEWGISDTNEWEEIKTTSCLVDMDFRGTGLETSLFKTTMNGIFENIVTDKNLLNAFPNKNSEDLDIIENKKYYNDSLLCSAEFNDKIFTKVKYIKEQEGFNYNTTGGTKKYFAFDACFSNPDPNTKNKFVNYSSKTNSSTIHHSYFSRSFQKFLDFLLNEYRDKKPRYKDIVFDLPPSYDDFVRETYDVILDINKKYGEDKKNEHTATLYIITTLDIGHINANFQYLKNLITHDTYKNKFFDKVVFVINDVYNKKPTIKDVNHLKYVFMKNYIKQFVHYIDKDKLKIEGVFNPLNSDFMDYVNYIMIKNNPDSTYRFQQLTKALWRFLTFNDINMNFNLLGGASIV